MKPSRSSLGLWARRLGWLVLLWTASVAAMAIVALILRALMAVAGLTI